MAHGKWHRILGLVAVGVALAGGRPIRGDEAVEADERYLRQAKGGTDGPALLAFLRSRPLTDESRKPLDGLIQQLGSESFPTREQATLRLVAYGLPARPYLHRAIQNGDPEISRRALLCLEEIDRGPGPAMSAAA